jgi:hypothetical protein
MTNLMPQPYPLWLAECLPGSQPPPAVRVIGWQANDVDGTLHPLVIGWGGSHTYVAVTPGLYVGAEYAYGSTPAEATQTARSSARRTLELEQAVAADGWPEPSRTKTA